MSAILRADGLHVRRGEHTMARGVSFDLPAGDALAVIGPNGSGKSSLLLGLRGLLPSTGGLHLDGVDPREVARAEVARHVAVVPQRNESAFPMRVEEMVRLGRAPHRRPWQGWSRADRELTRHWLDRLGLDPLRTRAVDSLSGGERRRVFIARALVQETPVLFLDEPFAGLDPAARGEILACLHDLRADGSRTLVLVLHDLLPVEELCTRVVGLRRGEVRIAGACGEVLDPAALEDLYGNPWEELVRPGEGMEEERRVLLPARRGGRR